jgi:hypothetical protein
MAREVLDPIATLETTTDEALVEHVRLGSPDPVVDHLPPPLVVEDLRAYIPTAADHMLLRTAEDRVP